MKKSLSLLLVVCMIISMFSSVGMASSTESKDEEIILKTEIETTTESEAVSETESETTTESEAVSETETTTESEAVSESGDDINPVNPLTFTAEEVNSSVKLNYVTGTDVMYKVGNGEWTDYTRNAKIELEQVGDTVKFFGTNVVTDRSHHFIMSGKIAASGDVTSLTNGSGGDVELTEKCYHSMFDDCTALTTAPNLPSTVLADVCYYAMFAGCTGLTEAPELPSTGMTLYCYGEMFDGCTGLTEAPELPATKLEWECYSRMFKDCTGLTEAPELPATVLAYYCYASMFEGCTGLTAAPELPATTMKVLCYDGMFEGCTGLTEAPELPSTSLAQGCYASMFMGCTGLVEAPELPATTMEAQCYLGMFDGCTGLIELPELPATSLAKQCYCGMFEGCTGLEISTVSGTEWSIPAEATATDATEWNKDMFSGTGGEFTGDPEIGQTYYYFSLKKSTDLLTFTAEKSNSSVTFNYVSGSDVSYRVGSGEWTEYTKGRTVNLDKGETVSFLGYDVVTDYENHFTMTGEIAASGDVTSLTNGRGGDAELTEKCYASMFNGCTSLTEAPELPSTTMADYCYRAMFSGCTNLVAAPELPSTALAEGCYWRMFANCTRLIVLPELPADTMAKSCYSGMFYGCENLTKLPVLGASFLAEDCYSCMFENCINLVISKDRENASDVAWAVCSLAFPQLNWNTNMFAGTGGSFTSDPEIGTPYYYTSTYDPVNPLTFTAEKENSSVKLNYVSGSDVMYKVGDDAWTAYTQGTSIELEQVGDRVKFIGTNVVTDYDNHFSMTGKIAASGDVTSLTNGSGGDAELTEKCYASMFNGCTALTKAPNLPSTVMAPYCYRAMFSCCTGLTEAPELPATTLAEGCYYNMFFWCRHLTAAPELPATTMKTNCYFGMFSYCVGFTVAPELPSTTLADSCYSLMFRGCTGLVEAPELPATTMEANCYSRMFEGCTRLTEVPELPATSLAKRCYYCMFDGCTGLRISTASGVEWSIPAEATESNAADWNKHMFNDTNGDFTGDPQIGQTYYYVRPLTFTAEEENSSVTFNYVSGSKVMYRLSGGTWTEYTKGTTISLDKAGDAVSFIGYDVVTDYENHFAMTGKIAADGDVTCLTNVVGCDAELTENCYHCMFKDCSSLTKAPELPATTMADYCYQAMFSGCTGLTEAPEMPATVLAEGCYSSMFNGCNALIEAPALPADMMQKSCYSSMFYGCTSLTKLPVLDASSLAEDCYSCMFENCTSLSIHKDRIYSSDVAWAVCSLAFAQMNWNTNMFAGTGGTFTGDPEIGTPYYYVSEYEPNAPLTFTAEEDNSSVTFNYLSGQNVVYKVGDGEWSYYAKGTTVNLEKGDTVSFIGYEVVTDSENHFTMTGKIAGSGDVTSLTNLSGGDTTLSRKCYASMFEGCTALTTAPELPATTMTEGCYSRMFYGCTSLTKLPVLDASSLAEDCYSCMFENCTSLSIHKDRIYSSDVAWAICSLAFPELNWNTNMFAGTGGTFTGDPEIGTPYYYVSEYEPNAPLTFTAEEDNSSVNFNYVSGKNIMYKVGDGEWNYYAKGTTVNIEKGDTVSFIGYGVVTDLENHFTMTGKIAGSGDVTSLTNLSGGDAELTENCYHCMFKDCSSLTKAPELPATTMADYCYHAMFSGCTGLIEAPELSATVLAEGCYGSMFNGCTALIEAPALPAGTMEKSCYSSMFYGCTSLTKLPVLDASILAEGCYSCMFENCASLSIHKDRIYNSDVAWYITYAASEEPDWNTNMFAGTGGSFTDDPEKGTAYYYAPIYEPFAPLTFTAEEDNSSVTFNYVSGKPVMYKVGDGEWSHYDKGTTVNLAKGDTVSFIGYGVVTDYENHFAMTGKVAGSGDVTSLTNLSGGDAELTEKCYHCMFKDCSSLTKAPELPAGTMADYCYHAMFSGCTSLIKAPELHSENLAESCYNNMFSGCTNLAEAPELPAAIMEKSCYTGMFRDCTSLSILPALNSTNLAEDCYSCMFENCTSLLLSTEKLNDSDVAWVIPSTAVQQMNWNTNMFAGTGGSFTSDPKIGTTYYYDIPACQIEETGIYYLSVEAAIGAAGTNASTIIMLENCKGCVTIEEKQTITLDLNGFVLKSGGSVITDNGKLTITDSNTDNQTHYFTVGSDGLWTLNTEASSGTALEALTSRPAEGTVVAVSGGVITGGNTLVEGGGIEVVGSLTINGGNIIGNTACIGGGIKVQKYGKVIMTGGNIAGNTASNKGGGVDMTYSTAEKNSFTMSGGAIVANTAKTGGGVNIGGDFTMTGGKICGNAATENGGGFYVTSLANGKLTLGGTATISGNILSDGQTANNLCVGRSKTVVIQSGFSGKVGIITASLPTEEKPFYVTDVNDADYSANFLADTDDIKVYNDKDGYMRIARIHKHSYTAKVTEPTCTKQGYTTYTCTCGDRYVDDYVDALGHDYGEWTVTTEPTCTEKGVETRYCSRCDAYETREVEALGHDLEHHDSKAATCTEIGWEAYDTCTRCDYTTYKEIPATGHSYGSAEFNWDDFDCKATFTCACCEDEQTLDCTVTSEVTKAATCTDTGVRTYTASVEFEGKTYTAEKEEILAALGHDYGEWTVSSECTCTENGVENRYCSRCDAFETREFEAREHDLEHHDAKAPTCTEAGWEAYDSCTRCNYTTYKEIPATGHSYTTKVTEPTCTEQGYTTYICDCGDSYDADYVDALGHDYGEWTVTTEPTCTDKGVETRYCSRCDAYETREVEALGHDCVHHDAKAPTCTEIGWEAYDTCTRCDYTTYKEISATGHSYTATVKKATTKAMGYTLYTCACGDSYKADYTLAAPTISIARSSGKPKISWSKIGGATKYYVYRSTDGKTYKYLTSTTKTSYTNSKAASGTKYYYKVKAVATVDGEKIYSSYSNVKSLMTTLKAPTLSKTLSKGHPKISWKAVTGADKYIVYYSTTGKKYTKLTTTTKRYVIHTKAKEGKKYYYKVKAVSNKSSYATSAYSKAVSITAK